MYYKTKNNKPYIEPSSEIIIRDGLMEITEEEFNQIVTDMNTPTPEQELQAKLQEANQYLKDTDWVKPYLLEHKLGIAILPEDSYKFEIEKIRQEKLEFIRSNS